MFRGQFLDANPALCSLLGYTREEILGNALKPFSVTHPESLPVTFQYLSLLLENKQPLVRIDKKYCCKVALVWSILVSRLLCDVGWSRVACAIERVDKQRLSRANSHSYQLN